MSDIDQKVVDTQILRNRLDSADSALTRALVRRWQAGQAVCHATSAGQVIDPADRARRLRQVSAFAAGSGSPAEVISRAWRSLTGDQLAGVLDGPILVAGLDEEQMAAQQDYFGTGPEVEVLPHQRSVLMGLVSGRRTLGCLPWPGASGQARWWAMLNESAHDQLRILGSWPLSDPLIAIVARGSLRPSDADTMLAIGHDDLCQADDVFDRIGLEARVIARLRSLVLCVVEGYVDAGDSRLIAVSHEGLEGFRLIGVAQKP